MEERKIKFISTSGRYRDLPIYIYMSRNLLQTNVLTVETEEIHLLYSNKNIFS